MHGYQIDFDLCEITSEEFDLLNNWYLPVHTDTDMPSKSTSPLKCKSFFFSLLLLLLSFLFDLKRILNYFLYIAIRAVHFNSLMTYYYQSFMCIKTYFISYNNLFHSLSNPRVIILYVLSNLQPFSRICRIWIQVKKSPDIKSPIWET